MSTTSAPVSALCFDKDGTLFDFATTWEAWAAAFLRRASEGDEARATIVGRAIGFDLTTCTFATDSIVIAGTPGEVTDALVPHFPNMAHAQILAMLDEEAALAPQVPAVPLVPLLQDFRARGLKLGVATNDSEAPALAHLEQAGVTHMFDFIAGFDSGFGAKPEAGQLLGFASAVDVSPTQVVMVGDSTHDLRAAAAAGMRAIGVLTGTATATDLEPYADAVLGNIGEIPAWLDTQA